MKAIPLFRILSYSAIFCVTTTVALGQWQPANGDFAVNVTAINSTNITYVGTNNAKLFRSDDDGDSWLNVASLGSSSSMNVVAIAGGQNAFASISQSSSSGFFRSTDNGLSWTLLTTLNTSQFVRALTVTANENVIAGFSSGIFRSTNNGNSWSIVYIQSGTYVNALTSKPNGYVFSSTTLGIRRSSNEGASWSVADSSLLNIPFSSIAYNSAGTLYAGSFGAIYRSTNDGLNWSRIYVGDSVMVNVTVSPSGVIVGMAQQLNRLFRSTNNGVTWETITFVASETPQCLSFSNSNKLFVGTQNRVFVSTDFGSSWRQTGTALNNKVVSAMASTNGDQLFAAVPAEGLYRSFNGLSWAKTNAGLASLDIRSIASDGLGKRTFVATYGGGLFASTNYGVSWNASNSGLTDVNLNAVGAKTPAIILAAGTTGLFRSLDSGATWNRITTGLPSETFTCIATKAQQPMFVGTSGSGVYRSTDNGSTWTQVNSGLSNLGIRSLAFNTDGSLFAATQAGPVFRSTNQGTNWTYSSSGLTSTDTRMLLATLNDKLLAATHYGVFLSTNNGDSWAISNEGLTNTDIKCLMLNSDGIAYAGTDGNGVVRRAYDVPPSLMVANRWMSLGSLQSWYSSTGCEIEQGRVLELQDGLRWPADRRNQDMEVTKGLWIGTVNFTDQNGSFYPRKVVHVGPRVLGTGSGPSGGFFPMKHELTNRFELPLVFVDNVRSRNTTIDDVVDRIDSTMKWDQRIENVSNTSLGLTMTRNIYRFSHEPHDNYIVYEYEFKNTGNVDSDPFIELPNQTLDSLYFFFQYKYAVSKEGCYAMGSSSRWGINTMLDTRGDGTRTDPPNEQFRAQYAWHGKYPQFIGYDNLGAPIWEGTIFDRADTIGRLGAAQFVGVVTLHAERSASDTTDDPAQPRTTTYKGTDDILNFQNNQYNVPGMTNEYDWMKEGHTNPRHAWLVQPDGLFNQPTGDPSLGTSGGWNAANGYGPYRLLPGETIRIVVAEAASGLSREATISVGRKFKQGLITARAKNDSILTGKDSLFQTFRRAIAAYNSGFNIGEPPRPPRTFRVASGNGSISLTWEAPGLTSPPIRSFRIYRTSGKFDNLYSPIRTVTSSERSYLDTSVVRGIQYFYYIVSVGDSLTSSRFYTQTYDPATAGPTDVQTAGTGVPKEFTLDQNYPNPFNPTTTIAFALPRMSNVRLTVFDILGREVTTLVSGVREAGYFKEEWNGLNVGSGVYFYRLEARSLDGTQTYNQIRKALLIK